MVSQVKILIFLFRRHSSNGREGFVPRNYLGMWPRIKTAHHD